MMKNIFILLFSITCLLAKDTKEVENTNEGKFSGVTYFDYTYLDSLGSFDIKRAELKYAKKLSEKYFFKMVLDVNRDVSGADIDKRLTAHIRNAQLTMRLGQKSFLYLGVIDMNMFNVQQKTWGHRYISKSAMDEYGFASVSDLGIGYKMNLGNMLLSFFLTNGEGYQSYENDGFTKFSMQFLYGKPNLKSVKSGTAFNTGIVVSMEPFEGKYGGDGTTLNVDGGEYIVNPIALKTFGGENKMVVGFFGGFTMDSFMAGFEYNQFTDFDDAFTATDTGDGEINELDLLTPVYTSYGDLKTSTAISTYFSIGITPKLSMFLRTDIYDPNTASENPGLAISINPNLAKDSETHLLLGFHYELSENVNFAPLLRYSTLEANDDPSIGFGGNFEINF